MKAIVIATVLTLASAHAAAQGPGSSKPVSPLERSAPAGAPSELIPGVNMPMQAPPGELERLRSLARASDGVSFLEKSEDQVKQFYEHTRAAGRYLKANEQPQAGSAQGHPPVPQVYRSLASLRLTFRPADLDRATLLAASPSGTIVDGRWTGVERFLRIPNAGTVVLTELDLAASNGKLMMFKDAVNTRVGGQPAMSKVVIDNSGATIEEVIWMKAGICYHLVYGPDMAAAPNGRKAKSAPAVSARSLAQELR